MPTYSDDISYCLCTYGGVTCVGLVSEEEAFLIPVSLFESLIAYYGEVAYGIDPEIGAAVDDELRDYPDDDDDRTIN